MDKRFKKLYRTYKFRRAPIRELQYVIIFLKSIATQLEHKSEMNVMTLEIYVTDFLVMTLEIWGRIDLLVQSKPSGPHSLPIQPLV